MKKLTPVLVAGALAATMLAGCSPAVLQAALQAAKSEGQGGSPAPGASPATATNTAPAASTAPAATASAGASVGASTAPIVAPKPGASPAGAADADIAAVAQAFMAAVDTASEDPEKVARLFITGLVAYHVHPMLGRAMMGYALRSDAAKESAASPTGFEPLDPGGIYFRTLDRNTQLGWYYLDSLDAGELVFSEAAAHVVVDKEYKAVDQGLSADGKMWTFYIKVNHPSNVRSRPVRLTLDGSKGWRVSNYSSLMVQP